MPLRSITDLINGLFMFLNPVYVKYLISGFAMLLTSPVCPK
ncbi:hypothetical protein CoNPh17_CDS0067 [Staphylococcus phage S-CoN_Ph17]|nr:hypothetical protein CoNPh17_CDS0067 [Staphylococcus phage S-CoN_Ph17]